MTQETPQQRYKRVHKDKLLLKNRRNMQARRADPTKRAALVESQRVTYYRRKYGLEQEDLRRLYIQQGGVCAICEISAACPTDTTVSRGQKLHVDHCHLEGRVRGLLCVSCNTAIGKLGDSAGRFRRALDYIEGRLL